MSIGALTLKELAATGVNLEVEGNYGALTLKEVVAIVVKKGGHITINGQELGSLTLKELAALGGKHITLKV
ncbi:hypothetical protein I4B00_001745 [Enterobacter asburiae]|nr:hypothetical protein [Enterobacter asburiae]